MERLEYRTRIAAPAEDVFDWHEEPEALERLTPEWAGATVINRSGGIQDGDTVTLRVGLGPLPIRWELEHEGYVPGRQFRDVQRRGPFRSYRHTHRFKPVGPASCELIDTIEYELPLGALGRLVAGWAIRRKFDRLFEWRHARTHAAFETEREMEVRCA